MIAALSGRPRRTRERPILSAAERRAFRLATVKRSTPRFMAWAAALLTVLSLVNLVLNPGQPFLTHVIDGAAVVVLLVGAVVLPRPGVHASVIPWYTALCAEFLVFALLFKVSVDPHSQVLIYILLVLTAFAPFILDLVIALLAATPMIIAFSVVSAALYPSDASDWVLASLAAVLLSMVLLELRVSGVDALAEYSLRASQAASRDPMTGTFNRRGLRSMLPNLAHAAARQQRPVFFLFVDVDDLKLANDAYGHDFGDEVILAVADSISDAAQDLGYVARWGGDEFVVVGVGGAEELTALERSIRESVATSGVDLRKWSGSLSLGSAVSSSSEFSIDTLVRAADLDMYEQRRLRRGEPKARCAALRDRGLCAQPILAFHSMTAD